MEVEATVIEVNKMGVKAVSEAMRIMLPRDLHVAAAFTALQVGDKIRVRVLHSRAQKRLHGGTFILAIGMLR